MIVKMNEIFEGRNSNSRMRMNMKKLHSKLEIPKNL